jgi:hypothetical protein
MNIVRNTITTLALVAVLALALPLAASAYTITPDNYDSLADVEVLFGGGGAAIKTVDGYTSLGVSGGEYGEISIGQSITLNFSSSQIVNSIDLVALFTNGNYNDKGDEVAQITAWSGSTSWTYTLTADTATSAVWTGQGTVSSVEATPGLQGSGGVWTITNPFGNAAIDSLVFTSLDNGVAHDLYSRNTDYGIGAVTTSPTPIPAAAWLLGSGLIGLIGIKRRMR